MAEEPFDHTNIEVIIQALQELVSQLNQILLNMRREIGQMGHSRNYPYPPPPPRPPQWRKWQICPSTSLDILEQLK